jgi:enolase-phosphatase E1
MTKLFLFDIEGTTTDINFVHKVLFPYSFEKMEEYVTAHKNSETVASAIAKVHETVRTEEGKEVTLPQVIEKLKAWITSDRKHPALKEIQGLIWDSGYSKGEFKGHLYPDVLPFFKRLITEKYLIGIYSSGSVHAQKLIFGFSVFGDLTPYISYFFDTQVGMKREKKSYLNISQATQISPADIHFFSDIPEELKAAQEAGMKVTHLVREGTQKSEFLGITSFDEF